MRGFVGSGALGIPHFYLINADGVVVGESVPTEAEIERLLDAVVETALDRELRPELAVAESAYRRGFVGPAHVAASAFSDHESSAVVADARYLQEKIADRESHARKNVETQLAKASVPQAYGRLLLVSHQFAGLPLGEWATRELTALKKDRAKMGGAEMKGLRAAWRKLEQALVRDHKAAKSAYERKRVPQLYTEIATKNRGTEPGRLAERRLKVLGISRRAR